MIVSPRPSAIRVFGKSMHVLAVGWAVAVAWLWIAEVEQHLSREGVPPPAYAAATLLSGVVPVVLIVWAGLAITRRTGPAPERRVERQEWGLAFWWSLVPNLLLLITAWVMIQEAQ